jgi:hypothetical protein
MRIKQFDPFAASLTDFKSDGNKNFKSLEEQKIKPKFSHIKYIIKQINAGKGD